MEEKYWWVRLGRWAGGQPWLMYHSPSVGSRGLLEAMSY